MNVQKHYDEHLAGFYSWMAGEFSAKQLEFQQFLIANGIVCSHDETAIDLGCGHGIQAVSLAKNGYRVMAVDFCTALLDELKQNSEGLNVAIISDDIANISRYKNEKPEIITCCGDTIAHLADLSVVTEFINGVCGVLKPGGKFVVSFRNYMNELKGADRIIPVKSDDTRIPTCLLDYSDEHVAVTDILYQKVEHIWKLKVSTYKKARVSTDFIADILRKNKLQLIHSGIDKGLVTLIAQKAIE